MLNVGVTDNLRFPVVLGNDLSDLLDLINPVQLCNAALTWTQVKQVEDPVKTPSLLRFYAKIETGSSKPHQFCRQRQQEKPKDTARLKNVWGLRSLALRINV